MTRYPEELLMHAKYPAHVGVLDVAMAGRATNHNCGDDLACSLRVEDDVVTVAKHGGVGCALSTAAFDWLCGDVVGKSVNEVLALSDAAVAERWNLVLSPMRARCAALSVQAVKNALASYVRS